MEPTFESLDDRMQEGYDLSRANASACCDIWLQVWRDFLAICERDGITSIEEFDRRFDGVQFVSNWLQDLDHELHNAGIDDPRYVKERKRVCAELLERFPPDPFVTESARCSLAESTFELGETEEADRLFRQWLDSDPRWGWGWVGWSDCYWLFGRKDKRDPAKAESILKEALAAEGVRNRDEILERLADLYKEEGKRQEEAATRRELERCRERSPGAFSDSAALAYDAEAGTPAPIRAEPKVGRNDPCPCGSGKKYKKCCGRA